MKVQVSTEFILETYNAINSWDVSYSINRLPQGDSVRYTVKSNMLGMDRKCAYYIATGRDE
jgi:hypothetical protein